MKHSQLTLDLDCLEPSGHCEDEMHVKGMEEDALKRLKKSIEEELADREQVRKVQGLVASVNETKLHLDRLVAIIEREPRHLKCISGSEFTCILDELEREMERIEQAIHEAST